MSILNRGRTLALGRRSRTEISGELLEQVKLNDISGGRLIGRSCSMKTFRHLILIFLLISQARAGDQRSVDQPTEPGKFFREFAGLSDEQIQDVRSGKAIAKVLQSPVPDEVFVFGTVYINSTPEHYLNLRPMLTPFAKFRASSRCANSVTRRCPLTSKDLFLRMQT